MNIAAEACCTPLGKGGPHDLCQDPPGVTIPEGHRDEPEVPLLPLYGGGEPQVLPVLGDHLYVVVRRFKILVPHPRILLHGFEKIIDGFYTKAFCFDHFINPTTKI